MRLPALLFLLVALSGCGPIEYITIVTFEASRSVNEARAARAAELAPYEYTAAVEYLHKAREVGGYARYHEAAEWGRRARDYGRDAVRIARGGQPATGSQPATGTQPATGVFHPREAKGE